MPSGNRGLAPPPGKKISLIYGGCESNKKAYGSADGFQHLFLNLGSFLN